MSDVLSRRGNPFTGRFMFALTRFHVRPGFVLTLAMLLMPSSVSAQNDGPPRLVLNIDGPNGRTFGLGFSRDSKRLYAAGNSKVVHVWDVGWNLPENPAAPPAATPIRTLRWEIARGLAGRIITMGMSPASELLAVAGTGARDPNGNITLFDLTRNEVETTLPPFRNPDGSPGHQDSVTFVDFAPNGRSLASVGMDGEVWVWTAPPGPGGAWTGRQVRPKSGNLFERQPVLFLSNEVFAVAERTTPGNDQNWRLAVYDVNGQPRGTYPTQYTQRLNRLARNLEGTRFAAASSDGDVAIFTNDNLLTPKVLKPLGPQEVSAVACGPGGLIALGCNNRPKGNGILELWNSDTGQLLDRVQISQSENMYAVAFSPDGYWLATHNDDLQEIMVFQLRLPDGTAVDKPLTTRAPIRLRGRGKEIDRVAFRRTQAPNQPLQIGFGSEGDRRIRSLFTPSLPDLDRLDAPAPEQEFIGPDTFSGGYRIRIVGKDFVRSQTLEVTAPNGQPAGRITLDIHEEGEYQGNYCFVPDVNGRPYAVAIGTDNHAAIYVYGLTGPGGRLPLWRYYRDHAGEVLSLSVSQDGRLLVSGAKDQTIKVWSLEGLGRPSAFPKSSLWGADFVLQGNQLVARNVIKSGIAYGRNLRDGDVVSSINVPTGTTFSTLQNPNEMLQGINGLVHYNALLMNSVRQGQPQPARVIVPGWEPLLTFFIDVRDEWAVFTPEGYYDASAAEGHTLFGWQFNRGPTLTPRFEPAGNLQKQFERPDVIREVLQRGSVADALAALDGNVPERLDTLLTQEVQKIPEIKIIQPLQNVSLAPGQNFQIQARVTFPAGAANQFEIAADYDGRALGAPLQVQDLGNNVRLYTWQASCDENLNKLSVFARENGQPLRGALQQIDTVLVRGIKPVPKSSPEVYVLAAGVADYKTEGLNSLKFPVIDAKSIVPLFTEGEYRDRQLFAASHAPMVLTDRQVTMSSLEQSIRTLEQRLKARPDPQGDLVIFYMAGHGKEVDREFYLLPSSLKTIDSKEIQQQGIAWSKLCGMMKSLPCRIVWMIDACHAGAAAEKQNETVEEQNKGTIREANFPNHFVLAAARANQEAAEFDDLGHGVFTHAVLGGLNGAADQAERIGNKDTRVSIQELAQYVRKEVRQTTNKKQDPAFVPTAQPPADAQPTEIHLLKAPVAGS